MDNNNSRLEVSILENYRVYTAKLHDVVNRKSTFKEQWEEADYEIDELNNVYNFHKFIVGIKKSRYPRASTWHLITQASLDLNATAFQKSRAAT